MIVLSRNRIKDDLRNFSSSMPGLPSLDSNKGLQDISVDQFARLSSQKSFLGHVHAAGLVQLCCTTGRGMKCVSPLEFFSRTLYCQERKFCEFLGAKHEKLVLLPLH